MPFEPTLGINLLHDHDIPNKYVNISGDTMTGALTLPASGLIMNAGTFNLTGGGTLALGGFTLTVPATGTAALLGTANIFTTQQFIDGSSDQIQLRVQGHSTQTAVLQTWEDSSGTASSNISTGGLWVGGHGALGNNTTAVISLAALQVSEIFTTSGQAAQFDGELNASAAANTIRGFSITAFQVGAQALTTARSAGGAVQAVYGSARTSATGTGTVTFAASIIGQPVLATGTTMTGHAGLFARSPILTGTGAIGTAYGLLIESQKVSANVTAGWGVYQEGASDNNYFAGNVGIGIAGATARLHVVGAADTQQLIVKGNATQTSNILEIQNSSGTVLASITGTGSLGVGTSSPDAKLEVLSTTEQLRLTYTDASVYSSFTTTAGGNLTIDVTGTGVTIPGTLAIGGATLGATIGLKVQSDTQAFLGIVSDAGTNNIVNSFVVGHNTSDTPVFGFGLQQNYTLQTTTTANVLASIDQVFWVDPTHASRTARRVFYVYDTAAREAFRIQASGSAAMVGFFGAAAVVQQLATTDLGTVLSNLGLRVAGTAYPITTSGAVNFTGGLTIATTNMTITDKDIVLGTTTGTSFGTATNQKLSFYGGTRVTRGAALTTQLTTVTFTAPGTPDYAWGAGTNSSAWGWSTNDEFKTAASVIANLQTRVAELEARLGSATGVNLFA